MSMKFKMVPSITFIVPTFNVEDKLDGCFNSLDELKQLGVHFNVVFVDDCSTDNTLIRLRNFKASRTWVHVEALLVNSGSPSHPRNVGLSIADGEFAYFLDPDDEIVPTAIITELEAAVEQGWEITRAPLIRHNGHEQKVMNAISGWSDLISISEKITLIISQQSTTVCGLISRRLLLDKDIRWPEELRLGEDTVFLLSVLSVATSIGYIDTPDFIYRTWPSVGGRSGTQRYEDRELANHLVVWDSAQTALEQLGVSYLNIRGQVALQSAYLALIRWNRTGISRDNFDRFHKFLKRYSSIVTDFRFSQRISIIHEAACTGNYLAFLEAIKIRLLIAGYDLKFILPAVPKLSEIYSIQIDEWSGHSHHDETKSLRMLRWADVVHCEWLLGNAVWYSNHVDADQRLVVRLHRFELTRSFGEEINRGTLDRVICVSLPTMEDTISRFGFERTKMRLIPNVIDIEAYDHCDDTDKRFNLAMVGILPALKGFHRALELLSSLVKVDSRYNLTVYGKMPQELEWIRDNQEESTYFEWCSRFMDLSDLRTHVKFGGWSNLRRDLADKGIVLSVSDFESFHVAPGEAFAAGNLALFLPWRGVEYIYPTMYICQDLDEMQKKILSYREIDNFERDRLTGERFVSLHFSPDKFVNLYADMIEGIW